MNRLIGLFMWLGRWTVDIVTVQWGIKRLAVSTDWLTDWVLFITGNGDIPTFTPASKAGAWFGDPGGMQGWVGLWLRIESTNNQKLMLEYEKFQELQVKSQQTQDDYDQQLADLKHDHERSLQELTAFYENQLHQLNAELEQVPLSSHCAVLFLSVHTRQLVGCM